MINLRKFARGQPCMVRLEGVCNGGGETSVLAHLRIAHVGGTAQKPPDLCGVIACSECHDHIDRRRRGFDDATLDRAILEALVRTLAFYHQQGVTQEGVQ